MVYYKYPRPAITVDAVVISRSDHQLKLVLIERAKPPFQGMWALPGGFIDGNETLEQAAIRELQEETGIVLKEMQPFRVFDSPRRDPRERVISFVFYAITQDCPELLSGDDAAKARWFPLAQLPPLAFDHGEIIRALLQHPGPAMRLQEP